MAFGDDVFLRGLKRAEKKKEREAQTAFQQGDWRGKKVEGKSASDEFAKSVGGGYENPAEDPFVSALHTIARTANVLQNAADGESEKNLSVVWASGKEGNSLESGSIFLSPDVIARETTLKPEWNLPERVDVLSADALLMSTLKRTASKAAFDKVKANEIGADVWYSLESLNAEREILAKFPGFEDYFAASRTYFCDRNAKASLEGRIAMAHAFGQGDPQGAVAALKWEMMYPDQPLNLPENYRKAVDWAKAKCLETDSSMSRAEVASDIDKQFLEWFPAPPGDGKGDDKKEGKGKGKSEGKPSGGSGGSSGDPEENEDEKDEDEKENEDEDKDEDKDGKDGEGKGKDKEDDKKDDKKDGKDGEGKDKDDKKGDDDKKDDKKDGGGNTGEEKEKKDKGDPKKDDKKDEGKGEDDKKPERKPLPKLPNIGQARRSLASSVSNNSHKAVAGKSAEIKAEPIPPRHSSVVDVEDANVWKNGSEVTPMDAQGQLLPYRKRVNALRARITALKDRIKLQAEVAVLFHRGLKSGLLDDGSLVKLCVDRNDDLIFENREILAKPSIAFGLLVDESGSMGQDRSGIARDVAIMLAEALRDFDGLKLCVMGHTTGFNDKGETLWMRHYLTPDHPHIESIMRVAGIADNLDGYAMESAARSMARWFPEIENKHLLVISDGQPNAYGYGGASAARHMRTVCDKSRAIWGINVVGVGIDKAYSPEVGTAMYGPGKSVVLDDSFSAISVLANYITKIVQRANVLR